MCTPTTREKGEAAVIAELITQQQDQLLADWIENQRTAGALRSGRIGDAELKEQSRRFLAALRDGVTQRQFRDLAEAEWAPMRELLAEASRSRALAGFTPSETAIFV